MIRIGIGGWVYEPWRGTFYPDGLAQKRELEFASHHLTSIEINGTYYGSQKPETFAKWHDETPDDFVFAVKAPRFATNRKVLADAGQSIERFFSGGLMGLKGKLGPINWQFMATKKFDPVDCEAFLDLLPASHEGRKLRHAVEVRHPSFKNAAFIDMLRNRGIAAVVSADGEFPQIADATAPFVYARILGTAEAAPPKRNRWATARPPSTNGPNARGSGRRASSPRGWNASLRIAATRLRLPHPATSIFTSSAATRRTIRSPRWR